MEGSHLSGARSFWRLEGDLYLAVRATLLRMEAEMDGMKGETRLRD